VRVQSDCKHHVASLLRSGFLKRQMMPPGRRAVLVTTQWWKSQEDGDLASGIALWTSDLRLVACCAHR